MPNNRQTFTKMDFRNHVYMRFFSVRLFICLIALLSCIPIHCQTKRALLIGISNYPQDGVDAWQNIHGANDVNLLSPTLRKQGFKTKVLTNKSATAKEVRNNLSEFIKSCKQGDIVYLHFSCHGQPVEDMDGDEEDGWDEALIPIDAQKVYQKGKYTGENHILDDELHKYLNSLRTKVGQKGFVYVVIDACHAGSSYRGDEEEDSIIVRGTNRGFTSKGKLFAPKLDKRGKMKVEKNPQMSDICILEACRSYQVNSEIKENGKYYGSLSFYVNNVLQTSVLGKNISWTDKISKMVDADKRLIKQNVVIETSL